MSDERVQKNVDDLLECEMICEWLTKTGPWKRMEKRRMHLILARIPEDPSLWQKAELMMLQSLMRKIGLLAWKGRETRRYPSEY